MEVVEMVREDTNQGEVVIKNENQSEIFKWLSHKNQNGWNDQAPSWNFCKYLIDEKGMLMHYFQSGVEPLSEEMVRAVEG